MTISILACKGCGRTKPGPTGDPTDLFPSEHCGDCPPWECETCGETCSATALCTCWVSLANMSTADVKALFAADASACPDGSAAFNVRPVMEP